MRKRKKAATRAEALHAPGTPESDMWKSDAAVRTALDECMDQAAQSDVLVAYLPRSCDLGLF